jgi:BirA family transcriptional regulator, biotin operon repressor / biotin---[acetyl-CoA-carboxylase] ligase
VTRASDDRRASVLDALREGPSGVSGEHLAREFGVSRVAVRKHVEALRESGYGIEARPGEGYRLLSSPDAAIPLEVRSFLSGGFVTRLEGGGVTGSTNDDARDLAIAGAPEGTVVLAREQTKGRGRLGRAWSSPGGGVYASVVLRPEVELPDAVVLPLVVGLGVARALDRFGVSALLKWPNDLLAADGRKLGGVLLEGLSEGWRIAWVVAGIGVNVRKAPDGAASIDGLGGRRAPLAEVAAAVLEGAGDAYGRWKDGGFAPLREEYEARAWLAGRDVVVSDAHGTTVAAGVVRGIDAQGRLLVEGAGGIVPVASGEVTLRAGGAVAREVTG